MNFLAILQPVFAPASWTGLVLILLGATRIRAGLKGQIAPADFALSNLTLIALWILTGIGLGSATH